MKTLLLWCVLFLLPAYAGAADPKAPAAEGPKESEYYKIITFETPKDVVLEVGSIELLPGGKLAVGTRRGEIWTVSGAQEADPKPQYQLFAEGQHEVFGLAYSLKDQSLYATNRYEVVRLKDEDGDGRADTFATVCDQWGISGDYHEFAFGSRFDQAGDLWVALCLTGSGGSATDFRGWVVRVKPDGTMEPTCSGIRSPGGIGFDADGETLYTDNQGYWRASSMLHRLVPGSFQGAFPGNKWYDKAPNMGPKPVEPPKDARLETERARNQQLVPPIAYMVHGKIGNSTSFVVCDLSNGKFGPFSKQLLVGDQSHSNIARVFVETVNGVKQGAVIPFLQGLSGGPIAGRMNDAGQLFVGGGSRGWGSRGNKPFTFERIEWTGQTPFEIHEMRVKPDGFELTFTQPIDAATAANVASYAMREFAYVYSGGYGSKEVDEVLPKITSAVVGPDKKSVRLLIDPLTKGSVHELHLDGVKSAAGLPLLHPVAYYTLNEIPAK